ncbi:beta strand repeat-containing protein [Hymenobacter baengnokdamensis]|uniref:beta strand repeat-containing protein n=1 Tax=Hymenobacter baengnokdamensis TaxID=2615203 RepID=UPI001247DD8F|nr:IPT/TIG domain-containing protein [Hymenobacter baengnokdamensis]
MSHFSPLLRVQHPCRAYLLTLLASPLAWAALLLTMTGGLLRPLGARAQSYTVTTLAGLANNPGRADRTGTSARFDFPPGVDGSGNVYVADQNNNPIRKITLGGTTATLSSLSPTSGPVGTSVTLTGTGLTGATGVSFNGTAAVTFAVVNATTVTATVPAGATTGNVTVTTAGGTSNGVSFTVTMPVPTLSGISPGNATVGSSITLNGTNLQGTSLITFPGTSTNTVTSGYTVNAAGTQITGVVVPGGATSGNLSVTTPGGTANFAPFNVVPTISNVSPLTGGPGTTVTLTGTGLSSAYIVLFNYPASSLTGNNLQVNSTGTTLTFTVPTNAQSGPLTVRLNSGMQATGSQTYVAVPVIQTFNGISSATAGDSRTFSGINFDNASSLIVGGAAATITANTGTSITFTVPATAVNPASGGATVSITTPGGSTTTSSLTYNIYPRITGFSPATATVGSTVTLTGTGFTVPSLNTLRLGNCNPADNLTVLSPTQATAVVSTMSCSGPVNYGGINGPTSATFTVAPAITSISPSTGSAGTAVVVNVSGNYNLTSGQVSFAFNGTAASAFTQTGPYQYTVTVPAGASTGPVSFTTPGGTATGPTFTVPLVDLTVSTGTTANPTSIPAGTYNTITVNSPGVAQLSGAVVVNTSVTVNAGATLLTNCQGLTGAASFTVAAGATLGVCDPAGISSTGSTGAVQTTGTRSFSTDASYVYNGTVAQSTGNALPSQVRNLSTTNANTLTLSAPTSVAQVLTMGGAGNLATGSNGLTLLSSASGTALVVNSGSGVVTGTGFTMQRYIDPSLNAASGYRHYSAPVSNTTLADLTTTGYTPEISKAVEYNGSATPGTTSPFPTLFEYDQSRLATVTSNYAPFDIGFKVPLGLTQATGGQMVVGKGYVVQIGAAQLVDFVGTPTTGDLNPLALSRNAAGTTNTADAGWQLVGNPYPSPLDYSLVAPADRANLDAAMYVVQSTGPYSGGYRAYVNGQSTSGTNNPLIASSQGFWVRVSTGQTSGSLTFRDAQRVTTYASQAAFQRQPADARPALRLELSGAGLRDAWVTYAEAGASSAFDSQYDAGKLPNSTGLNLSSAAGVDDLAIDGQGAFTSATMLPLSVGVPAAGAYTLTAAALSNLPAGLVPYLRDAQTGTLTALSAGTNYAFSVSAAQASALVRGRFALVFRSSVLASTPALTAAAVQVYPNPAHGRFTVEVPGVLGAAAVQAELRNAIGQVVARRSAALPASGTTLSMGTEGLAAGVYVLRLQAGGATLVKRVVLD